MVIDTGDETEETAKGKMRKAQPLQDAVSSDEDEPEDEDTGVVNDLITSNREAEERAADLLAELEATKASMRLPRARISSRLSLMIICWLLKLPRTDFTRPMVSN